MINKEDLRNTIVILERMCGKSVLIEEYTIHKEFTKTYSYYYNKYMDNQKKPNKIRSQVKTWGDHAMLYMEPSIFECIMKEHEKRNKK